MIDKAYLRFVAILREGSAQYYVKKRVNNIAGWSDELSKLKSDSTLGARQWRLAMSPMFGEFWVNKKMTKEHIG